MNNQLQCSCSNLHKKILYKPVTFYFPEKDSTAHVFYMVFSGSVKIYHNESAPVRRKYYLSVKSGESFGELSLIDGKPRSASAQTLENCVLLYIDRTKFLDLLRTHFDITFGIMQELSNRLRDTNQHVFDLTFLDARTRVIKSLIKLANKHGMRNGSKDYD